MSDGRWIRKKNGVFSISLVETTKDTPTAKNMGVLFQVHLQRDDKCLPPLMTHAVI